MSATKIKAGVKHIKSNWMDNLPPATNYLNGSSTTQSYYHVGSMSRDSRMQLFLTPNQIKR